MSAAGSDLSRAARSHGFTLIELMVVITLIAIATAGVTFALRDNEATLLDREADRLSTVLETVRVQSRSSGVAMAWLALPEGFAWVPAQALQNGAQVQISPMAMNAWLAPGINVQIVNDTTRASQTSLLLNAEPMIAPVSVIISLGGRRQRITTDGLRPFSVQSIDEVAKP